MDMHERMQTLLDAVPPPDAGDPEAAIFRARRRHLVRRAAAGGGSVVAAILVAVLGAGLLDAGPAAPVVGQEPEHAPEDLLWRRFTSVEVTQEGRERELVGDTPITINFNPDRVVSRRDEHGELERVDADATLTWRAGCNHFDSLVDVHEDRLALRPLPALGDGEGPGVSGTARGCSPEAHEQDDWLLDFFVAGPRWQMANDERLILRTDDTTIVFEERP